MRSAILIVLAGLLALASADVYMHNPRGCNNRYRGDNNNQNRLFDSQNNANGGYGWAPRMSFYTGSLLQVEWTAQHGCGAGHPNMECEIIFQYMCGPWIQDGTEDTTVPTNFNTLSPAEKLRYGLHEPQEFYDDCRTRFRNRGLFLATQNIGDRADSSRQNDGNRRGFECDEERDYYPYWHPSPWKDIGVLTSGPLQKRCDYYRANSQNRSPKGHCVNRDSPAYFPQPTWDVKVPATYPSIWGSGREENNQQDCEAAGGIWYLVPAWGIDDITCDPAPLSRDNHLGNADMSTTTASYKWTIPTPPVDDETAPEALRRSTCVLRLRYNITTLDYAPWAEVDGTGPMIDASYNGPRSPVKGDPTVNYGVDANGAPRNLTLAIDTSQFGRTFQDRSHSFYIKPRPASIINEDGQTIVVGPGAKIINLNVRGKRGNIVQAYPSVEYDFVPTTLNIRQTDLVHIQWTGCDTNNEGNAGEGTRRTDRSNIVQMKSNDRKGNYPWTWFAQTMFSQQVALRLAHLDQLDKPICNDTTQTGCCRTFEQLQEAGNPNAEEDPQNCQKLNAASDYFDGGLVQLQSVGTFHYMSSRNNNFSNRSQKGTISVDTLLPHFALAASVAGAAAFVGAAVVAGGVWYAKSAPTSAAANVFNGIKI